MKTLVGVAPAATFFRNLANHQHGSQLLIDVDGPMFVFFSALYEEHKGIC